MEHEVLGEFLAVPPDDPPDAHRGQPEFVSRGADRLDPREAEVEDHVWCAERGEEGAAGPVHVNVDVEAGLGLQPVEGAGQGLNRLVGAGIGDTERGDDHDRVLVHPLQHRGRVHAVAARGHRDLAHFDVPVPGELVPHHLDRAAHHVRLVCRLALGSPLRPPAPLGRHTRQHASLRGADGRGSHGVGRFRCMPEVGQHVHTADSISAVCGYSSLSIMFLLTESAIRASASGSAHVWQNVARFCRALPSSMISSATSWYTSLGSVSSRGNRYFGTGLVMSCPANTQSSICSRTVSRSCNGMVGISLMGSAPAAGTPRRSLRRAPGSSRTGPRW